MEPKEWTADIRLTLIARLTKTMLEGVFDLRETNAMLRTIYRLATQSDHWLNHHYEDVMANPELPVSTRLTWPTIELKGD